jgi:thiamine pyrophosphate-dependent acetolactate synthase large subunit-like protein|tara:strand:+ start:305 stop:775 length:471 start_codon:yes stop_codon:yes gene_type:complete
MLSRKEAIEFIFDKHPGAIYVTNTGYISRAVYDLYPKNKNIFYMQGSMGLAPCIGMGMALNTYKEVVVLSGDAALLMHLGITHTIADRELGNLFVYVLDNGCHESVGEFFSSQLEDSYLGIDDIIPITKDGKKARVELDCEKNTKQIKELFNSERF